MSILTFKRGIHPPGNKESTQDRPIEKIPVDKGIDMIYPMIQHIGAPCKPIVEVGDKVLKGQQIGTSDAEITSFVHSSVSGVVKEIKPVLIPTGAISQAVIIENDGEDEHFKEITPDFEFEKYSRKEIIGFIKEAGIVGLGGAGFPTSYKLSPSDPDKIDTIIVNGAECEPVLTSDNRLMIEKTEQLIRGLEIVLHIFPRAKGIIAIEDNKPEAIKKVTEAIKDKTRIKVVVLKTKYPQGAERQIIFSCTKREVPTGKLPSDIGVLVNNTDTIISVERAVVVKKPLTRKILTVSGTGITKPGNYHVRTGLTFRYVIEKLGFKGIDGKSRKMISGGPMMGIALFNLDVPVIKTTSSILFFDENEATTPKERNCIRCGRCITYCPMGLMPFELNQLSLRRDYDTFVQNNGLDCMECGCCSYTCPSKRHLAQTIKVARRELLAQNREK